MDIYAYVHMTVLAYAGAAVQKGEGAVDDREFAKILIRGEGVTTEFKRCGAQAEADVFETICSFANHAGGSIFLGVEDYGAVSGVKEAARLDIQRNIVNVINNPKVFKPAVSVEFESFKYEDKTVIRVWVPVDASVHSYKNVIYDRSVDSDIQLKLDSQISELYLRKQTSYTEQKVYPYVQEGDLDLSLLDRVRAMAKEKRAGHPWGSMDDGELLRSANLYTKNYATGEEGFNLAAVLLLGRENVLTAILPGYKTDAILRQEDMDRYDDRLIVRENLLGAYPILLDFCKKHLRDKFYLEDGRAVSPRDIIVRELISNTLIHREYSSPFPAKVLITAEELLTENGSKGTFDGLLDLSCFSPMPKNPIIANFFNQIGWAEELGSGAKNLLKYVKAYSGGAPSLIEGSVFRARIPLVREESAAVVDPRVEQFVTALINEKGFATTVDVRDGLPMEHKKAQRELGKLVETGVLVPVGNTRARRYYPARR